MKVNRLLIHEIHKKEGLQPKEPIPVKGATELEERAIEMVIELNKRYIKPGETYGCFNQEKTDCFKDDFIEYVNDQSDESLVKFGNNVVNKLYNDLKNPTSTNAKGGYLVFADYEYYGNFMGVFLIRNKVGDVLENDGESSIVKIKASLHIDYEHLAMASRINKKSFLNGEDIHLSFINKKNIDSKYFINWIGATSLTRNSEYTKNLFKIMKELPVPEDEYGVVKTHTEFFNSINSYIKNKPTKDIDLSEIGKNFYKDEAKITDYAQANSIKINTVFKPDPKELRKFVSIKVRIDKIDLSFPQTYIDESKVIVDSDTNTVVIHSEKLVQRILEEKLDNA